MNKSLDKKNQKGSLAAVVLAAAITLTGCGQYASQFTALLTNQTNDSSAVQTEAGLETETAVDERDLRLGGCGSRGQEGLGGKDRTIPEYRLIKALHTDI